LNLSDDTPGNILIRADANSEIGSGHVMRCLALAQAWSDAGGKAAYACRALPKSLEQRLCCERIAVHYLRSDSVENAAETAAIAHSLHADWIAVDGFDFNADFLADLATAEIPVALVDDHADRDFYEPMKMIINPNIFASPGMYQGYDGVVLAGPRFSLLRREFRSWKRRDRFLNKTTFNLLITMGGSDPQDVTSKVVQALDHVHRADLEITIVVGGSYRNHETLKRMMDESRHSRRLLVNVVNMAGVMALASAAVSAAGGSAIELGSMGIPMLLITMADNHAATAEEFEKRGLAAVTGWYNKLNSTELGNRIQQFIDDKAGLRARASALENLIDGSGACRVVTTMLKQGVETKV
jgi:UDP-2,4-diacetamido-2,4,6-trideoxy-beta-L-altropyranose hydrolase